MCQSSDSNNLLDEIRYGILCKLFNKYKSAIQTALTNLHKKSIADEKMKELDIIIQEVEKYPISWKFYKNQSIQFSQDFESLVIFYDEISKY